MVLTQKCLSSNNNPLPLFFLNKCNKIKEVGVVFFHVPTTILILFKKSGGGGGVLSMTKTVFYVKAPFSKMQLQYNFIHLYIWKSFGLK